VLLRFFSFGRLSWFVFESVAVIKVEKKRKARKETVCGKISLIFHFLQIE